LLADLFQTVCALIHKFLNNLSNRQTNVVNQPKQKHILRCGRARLQIRFVDVPQCYNCTVYEAGVPQAGVWWYRSIIIIGWVLRMHTAVG